MKIDVTKIEGYADMTPEEKVKALEEIDYDVPEPDMTGYIRKADFDKTSSELAEIKRKYNAQLSEDERRRVEHDEEIEALRKTVELMQREKSLAEIKAQYISMGYESELAEDTALATLDGDNSRIFANHKKFLEAHDKAFEASLLAKTPRLDGAGAKNSPQPKTKEEIMAIRDAVERQHAIAENIELFK